jgi:hypothetical protein
MGDSAGHAVVGADATAAPFWKYAAPGPAVGAPVACAPFVKYCVADGPSCRGVGAFAAMESSSM